MALPTELPPAPLGDGVGQKRATRAGAQRRQGAEPRTSGSDLADDPPLAARAWPGLAGRLWWLGTGGSRPFGGRRGSRGGDGWLLAGPRLRSAGAQSATSLGSPRSFVLALHDGSHTADTRFSR